MEPRKGPRPIPTRPPDPDRQEGGEHRVLSADELIACGRGEEVYAFIDRLLGKDRADSLAMRGQLIAPTGKYRLVGVDCFVGPFEDYLVGDFDNREDAIKVATAHGGKMKPHYVYDDEGKLVFSAGKP